MNEVPVSLIVRSTRPPRRKILRNAIVVVGVLFLGGIGSSFYRNHAAECAIREALEETDSREPAGWRLDAIEEQRRAKAPRAEDNAAVTVATVRVAIPKTWPTRPPTSNELFEAQLKRKFDPPPQDAPEGGRQDVDLVIELNPACFATLYERVDLPTEVQMDAVLTKELRAELARIQQAVDLADKLADQKDGHVPINWPANPWSTPIPWVDDARSVATMLRFRALLQAQDNDLDGALRTSRAILGAGRSVRDDPTLYTMLMRLSLQSLAVRSIQRTLAQGVPSADALKETQLLLQEETAEPMLQQAVRGERAIIQEGWEWLLNGGAPLGDFEQCAGPSTPGFRTSVQIALDKPRVKRGHPVLLRAMNECVDITELPIEQQADRFAEVETRMKTRSSDNTLGRLLFPSFARCAQANQRRQAELRTAICALAAERFRQEHQRWPRSPAELEEGKYLGPAPKDPFTGDDLGFKLPPEGGVRISSVGPLHVYQGAIRWDPKRDEIDFHLWNREHRRQPPAELLPAPADK
jgi:hypothetical protein